ncbi:hypothetical protein BGX23_009325 [Mortierella sp. AD031]|nr:hypothetical protein BGX23_009325 [Mortierella sp. AD031]
MDATTSLLLQRPRQSPLDIPEILIRIGQFLPLWSGEGFRLEFDPCPLLRCCLVSRAFRQAFLPTLWYLYDGYRMRNIPPAILTRYSPYFRIITSTGPFKGPFQCKNLTELNTVYGQEWSRALLVSNPGLKRLVWGGPFSRRIETLEQQQEWQQELKVLMGLENLDEIRMSGFSLGEGIFVKLLRNNASSLSNLAMSTVAGVTSIEGLELPHLTELQVTFGCAESPALLDLVRCCPRLQRLSLLGSKTRASAAFVPPQLQHQQQHNNDNNHIMHSTAGHPSQDLDNEVVRLAQNISECCPELTHIKFTTTSTTGGAQTNAVFRNQSFLQGRELALITNACRRLEGFTAELATLDQALTSALMTHSSILKSLSLTFHETDLETTRMVDRTREMNSLRRLKASLSNLQDLHLVWAGRLSANIAPPPSAPSSTSMITPVLSTPASGSAAINTNNPSTGTIGVAPQATTTTTTTAIAIPAAGIAESETGEMNVGRNAFSVQEEVTAFLEDPWASLELETLRLHGMFRSSPPTPTLTAEPDDDDEGKDGRKEVKVVWRLAKGTGMQQSGLSPVLQHTQQLQYHQPMSGGEGSRSNKAIQRRLLENVTGLTKLRHLCFNYTTYERIPLV